MITCWIPVSPDKAGNYLATPGHRYATLINVDMRAPISIVTDALKNQGFEVTYSWQNGQEIRGKFLIDRWLRGLPASASGKTWMFFEMDYKGDAPKSIVSHIQKCFLSVCGGADIENVFEAQDVPDGHHPCGPGDPEGVQIPQPNPGSPAQQFPWQPALAGVGLGFFVGWLIAR